MTAPDAEHASDTRTFASTDKSLSHAGPFLRPDGIALCKMTKADSPILSWLLEVEYVNEVAARGSAQEPNLWVPVRQAPQGPVTG